MLTDARDAAVRRAYKETKLARLAVLKRRYDMGFLTFGRDRLTHPSRPAMSFAAGRSLHRGQ